jgi:hypothetical protein
MLEFGPHRFQIAEVRSRRAQVAILALRARAAAVPDRPGDRLTGPQRVTAGQDYHERHFQERGHHRRVHAHHAGESIGQGVERRRRECLVVGDAGRRGADTDTGLAAVGRAPEDPAPPRSCSFVAPW